MQTPTNAAVKSLRPPEPKASGSNPLGRARVKNAGRSDGASARSPKKTSKTPVADDNRSRVRANRPNSTRPVTQRQREVLEWIYGHESARLPWTIRGMCEAFGWASTHAAVDHLLALEKKGLLKDGCRFVHARGPVLTPQAVVEVLG